ncbi:MAG: DNA recombination protein RmuC [Candidatus Omnitrophica bacterium]|nr:DNA recombination protein RmuC [Candidatus Omnitrophota bacterium]
MSIVLAMMAAMMLAGLAWLAIYIVREATRLKTTTESLQQQLAQFKEGGFDQLIREKLALLTQRADESRREVLEHQQRAAKAAEEFNKSLGAVTAQISTLRDLQARVGELNDLLKPQQLRGELGEVIVRTLIADKLPKAQYEEEYAFADGKKVEFVVRLNDRLIPIDSKLQLEDFKRVREATDERQRQTFRTEFKRTVKQKIDEVKAYIRPEEGTFNFALMVIPSEAVFYDLIAGKDFTEESGLYDYARSVNVFLVSPLTFWAYLTALAQGLHGLEIERRSGEILASLQTLAGAIRSFAGAEFRLVGEHLRNASTKYDDAKDRLRDITETLTSLERAEAPQLMEGGTPT